MDWSYLKSRIKYSSFVIFVIFVLFGIFVIVGIVGIVDITGIVDIDIVDIGWNLWHLIYDIWLLTFDIWHLSFIICHLSFDIWHLHLTFDMTWYSSMILTQYQFILTDGFCKYLSNMSLTNRSVTEQYRFRSVYERFMFTMWRKTWRQNNIYVKQKSKSTCLM